MRLVIVSGLSGSGKTVALRMLEDLGYFCIDNIPVALLPQLIEKTLSTSRDEYEQMAVGIDARSGTKDISAVPEFVDQIRSNDIRCQLVFLQAEEETLLKRYSETRRRHPLSGDGRSLADAISKERQLLEPVVRHADLIVDTTRTSVHDLREQMRVRVHGKEQDALSILFESFGFKNGVPNNADFVFDVRSLPNPYWEAELQAVDGRDPSVVKYMEGFPVVQEMIDDIIGFLERWIEEIRKTNRIYLTIAIGCTGGRHRSVYVAEKLADYFRERYPQVLCRHPELS